MSGTGGAAAPVPSLPPDEPDGVVVASRILTVVSGSSVVLDPLDRVVWFLRRLARHGPIDLVLVHAPSSSSADRRRWHGALESSDVVERSIAVVGEPVHRSGRLRDVHLHRPSSSDRPQPASEVSTDAFVADAPAPYRVLWFGDLTAMARVRIRHRRAPAFVDVEHSVELGGARDRRAARAWAASADLVTVATDADRTRLAVPGALVVAAGGPLAEVQERQAERFDQRVMAVLERATWYQPVRSS